MVFEPSSQLDALVSAVAQQPAGADSLRAIMQRESDFASPLEAKLTGIAVDPQAREVAEQFLDAYWADPVRQQDLLNSGLDSGLDSGLNSAVDREVVIGSGFHAAVYAAVRVLSGHRKPLVLERSERVGGVFTMTTRPTFSLNSRNRAGSGGLAGDLGASLNYLPGAPIQAANVSMAQFQSNTDLAFVIRLSLAQFADVVADAEVRSVSDGPGGVEILVEGRGRVSAGRVIDARGLGDPADQAMANGSSILTFPQFMQRMAGPWPLRGLRRVAVVGSGDSSNCAVESFLGIAPPPMMAAAALDEVERIDWYASTLPATCDGWQRSIRGRYQAIGRYLRPDRYGVRRLNVVNRRARPVALPGQGLIEGRTYDLVVVCTGHRETSVEGLEYRYFDGYATPDGTVVARRHDDLPAFRVGPHARLPFTAREEDDGVADIQANAVSLFRTASKTAALAATLGAPGTS